MRDLIRQWINVVATIALLTVNALASALPLNGQTTGEISDQFDVYFVPAGYVFAIWGVIYLGLLAFTVYQALPGQRENRTLRRIGLLYALSCALNIAWLFLWHYEQFLFSLVVMVGLLLSLVAIYLRLGIGRIRVPALDEWLVQIPFSIYLGWITVATIANATSLLDSVNWNGWGLPPEAWAVIMIVAAGAITTVVSLTRGDIAYVLVIVWALVGIVVKHQATWSVAVSAGIVAGWVALTLLIGVPLHRKRLRPWPQEGAIHDRW
jgi:translocator protein